MTAEPVVATALLDGVLTVTMTDEARRNALSAQMVEELTAAFDEADRSDDVRVVVLTNTGSTFCAGASLAEKAEGIPSRPAGPLFRRFAHSPKPYIGRIAGHCVGGGMGLAAAMDVAVAADDVRFGFTEVRIGVAPAIISVVCLPKLRPVDARAEILRGRRLSAAEVADAGLIYRAVPRDGLDALVDEIVGDILQGGPEALAASKQLLAEVPGMPVDEAFAWTEELSARLFASDEGREGMAAFAEKRPPRWSSPNPS